MTAWEGGGRHARWTAQVSVTDPGVENSETRAPGILTALFRRFRRVVAVGVKERNPKRRFQAMTTKSLGTAVSGRRKKLRVYEMGFFGAAAARRQAFCLRGMQGRAAAGIAGFYSTRRPSR